jgi:branched-chain amino acid transport system permease protein
MPGCSAWRATSSLICSPPAFGHTIAIVGALAIGLITTAGFAALSLRATGISFIMITLALGEILWGLAYRWISLTNGDNGISVSSRPKPFGSSLHRARHSTTRRCHLSCRDGGSGDLRAFAIRRGAVRHARPAAPHECARLSRLDDPFWAFMFSGLLTSIAGILFVYYNEFISPQALALTASAEGLLMVISGGAGTLLGPMVGAALVVIVKNVVSAYVVRWNFMLGAIFRRHRDLHAGRSGAGRGAACAARWRAGRPKKPHRPPRCGTKVMTALAVTGI